MAAEARTGKLLWHFYTGGSIRASPMTYSVAGKQYLAITTRNGVYAFALR
jgi:outer membrane protein assembly factor BamB